MPRSRRQSTSPAGRVPNKRPRTDEQPTASTSTPSQPSTSEPHHLSHTSIIEDDDFSMEGIPSGVPVWTEERLTSPECIFTYININNFAILDLSELRIMGFDIEAYLEITKDPLADGEFMATVASGVDSKIPERIQLLVPAYHRRLDRNLFALTVAALTNAQFEALKDADFDLSITLNAAYVVACAGLISKRKVGDIWERDGDWRFTKEVASGQALKDAKANISRNPEVLNAICSLVLATKVNFWNTNHHTSTGNNPLPPVIMKIVNTVNDIVHVTLTKEAIHTYGHWASTLQTFKYFGKTVRETEVIGIRKYTVEANDDIKLRMDALPAGCHKIAFCNQVFNLIMKSTLHAFLTDNMVKIMTETMKLFYEIKRDDTRYHVGSMYLTGERRLTYDDNTSPGGMAICYITHILPISTLARSPYYLAHFEGGYKALPGYSAEFEALVSTAARVYATARMRNMIGTTLCERVKSALSFDNPSPMAAQCHHAVLSTSTSDVHERISSLAKVLDDHNARVKEKQKERDTTQKQEIVSTQPG